MNAGQFVAFYTNIGNPQEELWRPTFIRSIGEPPLSWFFSDEARRKEIESDLQSASPRYRHPTGEHGRFEPEYGEQFLGKCHFCQETSLAIPAVNSDEEALRILGRFHSIKDKLATYLLERFYIIPRKNLRNPKRSRVRISNLIKPIELCDHWAYFLGGFRDRVGVFISRDYSDVERLLKSMVAKPPRMRAADWLGDCGVIEKW
jgi:hypothetical protein